MSMSEEVVVCKYVWERDIAGRKMREECRKKCNKEGEGLDGRRNQPIMYKKH
jgi:hypothetical protein